MFSKGVFYDNFFCNENRERFMEKLKRCEDNMVEAVYCYNGSMCPNNFGFLDNEDCFRMSCEECNAILVKSIKRTRKKSNKWRKHDG